MESSLCYVCRILWMGKNFIALMSYFDFFNMRFVDSWTLSLQYADILLSITYLTEFLWLPVNSTSVNHYYSGIFCLEISNYQSIFNRETSAYQQRVGYVLFGLWVITMIPFLDHDLVSGLNWCIYVSSSVISRAKRLSFFWHIANISLG